MRQKQHLIPIDVEVREKLRRAWLEKSLSNVSIEEPLPQECEFIVVRKVGCFLIMQKKPCYKRVVLEKLRKLHDNEEKEPIVYFERGYE